MKEVLLIFTLATSQADTTTTIDHVSWPINITQEQINSGEAEVWIPIANEFINIKWETSCNNCDEID